MTLTLRYMCIDDIPRVLALDALSFPLPWSEKSYQFEITENHTSHMIVLEAADPALVIGYAGLWLIEDEAHISTIAVDPALRGNGYGEVLLAGMLGRMLRLGAASCVLEVRVGNTPAITLYRKYGFDVVHRRRNYYRDNGEDAFVMIASGIDDPTYRLLFDENVTALGRRVTYADRLDEGRP